MLLFLAFYASLISASVFWTPSICIDSYGPSDTCEQDQGQCSGTQCAALQLPAPFAFALSATCSDGGELAVSLCSSNDCGTGCQQLPSFSCSSLDLPGVPGHYSASANCQLSGLSVGLIAVSAIVFTGVLLYYLYKCLVEYVRTSCVRIVYVEVPQDAPSTGSKVAAYKERLKESQRRVQELQGRMESRLAEMDRQAQQARAPVAAMRVPPHTALYSREDTGLENPLLGGADDMDSS